MIMIRPSYALVAVLCLWCNAAGFGQTPVQIFDQATTPAANFSTYAGQTGEWRWNIFDLLNRSNFEIMTQGFGSSRVAGTVPSRSITTNAGRLLRVLSWRPSTSTMQYPIFWQTSRTQGATNEVSKTGVAGANVEGTPALLIDSEGELGPNGSNNYGPFSASRALPAGSSSNDTPGATAEPGNTFFSTVTITNGSTANLECRLIGTTLQSASGPGGEQFYSRIYRLAAGETATVRLAYNQAFLASVIPMSGALPLVTGAGMVEAGVPMPGPSVPSVQTQTTGGTASNGGIVAGTRPGSDGSLEQRHLEQLNQLRSLTNAVADGNIMHSQIAAQRQRDADNARVDAASTVAAVEDVSLAVGAATAAINAAKTEGLANAQTLNQQLENSIEFVGAEIVQAIEETPPGSGPDLPTVPDVEEPTFELPNMPDFGAAPSVSDIPSDLDRDGSADGGGVVANVEAIKEDMGRIQTALSSMLSNLNLNRSFASSAWVFTLPGGDLGTMTLDVESWAGWLLTLVKGLLSAVVSLWFFDQLIKTVRSAFS